MQLQRRRMLHVSSARSSSRRRSMNRVSGSLLGERVEGGGNTAGGGKRELEERTAQVTPVQQQRRWKPELQFTSQPTPSTYNIASMETPISRPIQMDYMPSAMKGVVLTLTGEILATPLPTERVNLFNRSPKVGLNFGKSLTLKRAIAERRTVKNGMTGLVRPRARARRTRRRKQRIKTRTRTTHYRRILHPHLVRVR